MRTVFRLTVVFLIIIACRQGIFRNPPPTPTPPIVNPRPSSEPGDHVPWINFPPQKTDTNPSWGAVLTDIEQHLNPRFGRQYYASDAITHGHETTHGINSDLRMKFAKEGQNGIYCLQGRAAILTDPHCRIRDVAPLIPSELRGMRYNLYLIQQARDWNNQPTYLFDEWISYINGTEVGIDQVKRGIIKRSNWSSDDGIAPMEFTYYCLALCLAVKKHDPGYFQAHPEFVEFVAFNIRRSVECYRVAIKMQEFKWSENLITSFRTAKSAEDLRNISVELFGREFAARYLFN